MWDFSPILVLQGALIKEAVLPPPHCDSLLNASAHSTLVEGLYVHHQNSRNRSSRQANSGMSGSQRRTKTTQ